jgi:hypothetical protein
MLGVQGCLRRSLSAVVPLRGSKLRKASRKEVRAMTLVRAACRRQDSLTLRYRRRTRLTREWQ